LEAKVLIEDYRGHYNHRRPHSALGYLTPAEFAVAADLERKVENADKPEELESILMLSLHLVQKTGSGDCGLSTPIIDLKTMQ
jgi:Integrase core domain